MPSAVGPPHPTTSDRSSVGSHRSKALEMLARSRPCRLGQNRTLVCASARPTSARRALPPICSGVIARGNLLRRAGPEQLTQIGLRPPVETTDARKAAAHVPSSDADLLLQ